MKLTRYTITGSTGTRYEVARREDEESWEREFSCTCPDHVWRHRDCRHIKKLREALAIVHSETDAAPELDGSMTTTDFCKRCGPTIRRVLGGETIILTSHGDPVARLCPIGGDQ